MEIVSHNIPTFRHDIRWWLIWNIGHRTSCRFLPSCEAFSASFILLANSRSVSSMSSKPSGGGLRFRAERTGGMSCVSSLWLCDGFQKVSDCARLSFPVPRTGGSDSNTVTLNLAKYRMLGLGLSWVDPRMTYVSTYTSNPLWVLPAKPMTQWWLIPPI